MSARRLVANLGALALGRILTLALSTATLALVARDLGPSRYGELALALAYTAVVAMVADAGVSFIAPRDLARIEDVRLRGDLAAQMVVLSTCIFAVVSATALGLALVVFSGQQSLTRTAVGVLLIGGLFTPLLSIGSALASAGHRQHLVAIAQVVGSLSTLIAVLAVVALNASAAAVAAAYAATTAAAGLALVGARGVGWSRPQFNMLGWGAILSESLPMLAVAGINTLYARADILLLAILTNSTEVGKYGLAYKVADAVIALPSLFILVLQPLLVRAHRGERFDAVMANAMLAIELCAIPIVATLVCLAPGVSLVLGGHSFSGTSGIVAIVAVAAGITFPSAVLSAGLVTLGRQRGLVVTTAVALTTNLIANLVLIPAFGKTGAAWALVISESAVLGAFALTYKRYARLPRPLRVRAMAGSAAGMVAVVLAGPRVVGVGPVGNLVVWGGVGAAAYCAVLFKLGIPQSLVNELAAEGRGEMRSGHD